MYPGFDEGLASVVERLSRQFAGDTVELLRAI